MLPITYAIRNLFRDPGRLAQTVGGSALVVLLVMSALAFNRGMTRVLSATGSERNVILLGAGSEESIERSEVHLEAETLAQTIRGLDQQLGQTAVSGEIHYMAPLTLADASSSQARLRGVTEKALLVHPNVRVLAGRFPNPGEVMVGRLAHHKLGVPEAILSIGKPLGFGNVELTIAGHFEAPGTVMESEVWFDRNDLATLTQRDSLSCVVARLGEAEFDDVAALTFQRTDMELAAITESTYYARLASFYRPIRAMTWLTAALVAAGAVFGGLNTLYAAFASRIREMGTLQAVGFARPALLASLIQESVLATLTGTLLATIAGVFLLDGFTIPFSVGTFTLSITPTVLIVGIGSGLLLGLLGALPPPLPGRPPPPPRAPP
jgi:putative ABC transport system permease protein